MNITLLARGFAFCFLLCAAAGMMVHYANHAENQSPYPSAEEVDNDYQAHIGDKVNFWAEVVAVREGGIVVNYGETLLFVRTTEVTADPGDVVQLYGTLQPEQQLSAERVVVSPQPNRVYMLSVSVIGVLLSLTLFARHWCINTETWTIIPRSK